MLWWCVCVLCVAVSFVGGDDFNCHNLQRVLEAKKWTADMPLSVPIAAQRRPCGKESRACCSANVEDLLTSESRKDLLLETKTDMNTLHSILFTRVRRFNDFFTTLLLQSKKAFDEMFKATYGVVYEENAYLFTDLFEELERYYSKGQVDLEEAMDNFFNTLYQKMFTVLNAQYQFDEKYLSCVGDHMKDLKPFGDVPQKLSVQIKRSFVATRTFAQGLAIAKDVVFNMQNLGLAGDCGQSLMRMTYCQQCRGTSEVKPCGGLCLNVMKGCLAYHTDLDAEWNHFLDAMDRVIVRLLGPFNIEYVVEPIDIKISEAIMNFQENAQEVSEKVFSGCGRPGLNRRGRATREVKLESYPFSREGSKSYQTIENLIREIRVKVKESRNFWSNLPYRICNNRNVIHDNSSACWNGTHVARYTRAVTPNGLNSQASNPEVSIDTTKPRSVLNEQVFILKTLTSKLKNAYNGYDVEWPDTEVSSGSDDGSGIGSGDDEITGEGSGHGHGDVDSDYNEGRYVEETVPENAPEAPTSPNNESNIIPNVDTASSPSPGRPSSRGSTASRLSILRLILAYVFPIFVVWIGGIFN